MALENLRTQIDAIDQKVVGLLNTRAKISKEIAAVKNDAGKALYSPGREQEVLRRISAANKGPLTTEALEAIYREIMSFSLSSLRRLKIAFLGPQATYSHMAALKRFGSMVEYASCQSISGVFLEVERGNADYGVVPVENSIEGAVTHTLDMFMDSDLRICAQVVLGVSHNLLARIPMHKIRRVYSNPQVLGQCRMWLEKNLPKAELVDVSSSTRAAEIAVKEAGSACIASALAARIYKLKILAANIEDSGHNMTRFFVIAPEDSPRTRRDKTSVMFSIKDKVGALYEMLYPFKKYNINLTKIESRPSKKKAWDYYFFMDLEGHHASLQVKKALKELEGKCKFFKVLGSYPVGA